MQFEALGLILVRVWQTIEKINLELKLLTRNLTQFIPSLTLRDFFSPAISAFSSFSNKLDINISHECNHYAINLFKKAHALRVRASVCWVGYEYIIAHLITTMHAWVEYWKFNFLIYVTLCFWCERLWKVADII